MVNVEIRKLIFEHGLKYYDVADRIGIGDSTFSVWLRKELEGERRERTLHAINELVAEKEK